MSSDIDQKKLSVATDWISKLANGINPIDGSVLPDSDVVNNVHISRCLFFVSNLLEDMGKKKHSSKKQYEQEFQITPEIASSVYIAEKTGIAMFVKEINKVIPENMKPLGRAGSVSGLKVLVSMPLVMPVSFQALFARIPSRPWA